MAERGAPVTRRWERADVNLAVVCRSRSEVVADLARKLGAGGMFVETESPRPVGSRVELEFRLPGLAEPVEISGRVAWVGEIGGDRPGGMGIAFDGVEGELQALLDRVVRSMRPPAVS